MKYLIYSVLIVLTISNVKGQELQKVYSVVKELQTEEWYVTQKELWKKEVKRNKKNAVAWENYYNAARALKNLSWQDKALNKERRAITKKIADEVIKAIPKTYQANLIVWRESGNDPKEISYLEKAYELNPNNEEVLVNMLTQSKLMGKDKEYSEYCKQYYKTNDISLGLLNWGYNLLSELDQNAIVFTSGDNDTYPLWLLQEAKGVRTDVKVLNYQLLGLDDYREKVFKKLGLPELGFRINNSKTQDELIENRAKMVAHIIEYSESPIYVCNTSITYFQEKYAEQLHLTGLTYRFSKESIDNTSLIIRNFEKRYLLDYLKISLSFNIGNKVAENSQVMYLPALTKLYKHYKNTEQSEKLKEVKELLTLIGERTGSTEDVNEILGK